MNLMHQMNPMKNRGGMPNPFTIFRRNKLMNEMENKNRGGLLPNPSTLFRWNKFMKKTMLCLALMQCVDVAYGMKGRKVSGLSLSEGSQGTAHVSKRDTEGKVNWSIHPRGQWLCKLLHLHDWEILKLNNHKFDILGKDFTVKAVLQGKDTYFQLIDITRNGLLTRRKELFLCLANEDRHVTGVVDMTNSMCIMNVLECLHPEETRIALIGYVMKNFGRGQYNDEHKKHYDMWRQCMMKINDEGQRNPDPRVGKACTTQLGKWMKAIQPQSRRSHESARTMIPAIKRMSVSTVEDPPFVDRIFENEAISGRSRSGRRMNAGQEDEILGNRQKAIELYDGFHQGGKIMLCSNHPDWADCRGSYAQWVQLAIHPKKGLGIRCAFFRGDMFVTRYTWCNPSCLAIVTPRPKEQVQKNVPCPKDKEQWPLSKYAESWVEDRGFFCTY